MTGARVKIGFRIALKLLRCGATVVATSRFVADAARRFAAERDRAEWRERLHVVGADFRDLRGLEVDFGWRAIERQFRCGTYGILCCYYVA